MKMHASLNNLFNRKLFQCLDQIVMPMYIFVIYESHRLKKNLFLFLIAKARVCNERCVICTMSFEILLHKNKRSNEARQEIQ